jgi:hypothetical protein
MIQRIRLTPNNNRLIGAYHSKADTVIVECDTTVASFSVVLPPLNLCENVTFQFVNSIGSGIVTVTGSVIDYNYASFIVLPNASVTVVDGFRGSWITDGYHAENIFGDYVAGNYSKFEADGTLVYYGAATQFEDIGFPLIVKTTGVGRPTYATYSGTLESLRWAINDVAQAVDNEIPHAHKNSSAMTWHVHFYTAVQDASNRYLKWEIAYTGSNYNVASPAETVISAEIMIPANTPALTHYILDIGQYNPVDNPGFHIKARLKRIAASGTAPSVNPFCELMQLHFEKDSGGSRKITTK